MKIGQVLAGVAVSWLMSLQSVAFAATRSDVGGPFELVDQNGAQVTQASFLGKPVLLYFGYATCPDVCPLDLAKMASIARRIHADTGVDVTPVFVTIDPERDTPEKLKRYVGFFGKDFVGLTGTPEQIAAIGDEYHVYYKKVPAANGGYMMDHSTMLFLLGADGGYLDHYGRALSVDEILARAVAKLNSAAVPAAPAPAFGAH